MKMKRLVPVVLTMLLVAGFLFAYPTVAQAASSSGGSFGDAFSNFFNGILGCLTSILQGIIDLFAILINFVEDLIMMIVGLFS